MFISIGSILKEMLKINYKQIFPFSRKSSFLHFFIFACSASYSELVYRDILIQ